MQSPRIKRTVATDPQDAYDRWAAQNDTDANDTRDLNAKVLRKQTFIEVDDVVLGLGCGTVLNTEWLVAQAGPVVATNVSGKCPPGLGRGSIPVP